MDHDAENLNKFTKWYTVLVDAFYSGRFKDEDIDRIYELMINRFNELPIELKNTSGKQVLDLYEKIYGEQTQQRIVEEDPQAVKHYEQVYSYARQALTEENIDLSDLDRLCDEVIDSFSKLPLAVKDRYHSQLVDLRTALKSVKIDSGLKKIDAINKCGLEKDIKDYEDSIKRVTDAFFEGKTGIEEVKRMYNSAARDYQLLPLDIKERYHKDHFNLADMITSVDNSFVLVGAEEHPMANNSRLKGKFYVPRC